MLNEAQCGDISFTKTMKSNLNCAMLLLSLVVVQALCHIILRENTRLHGGRKCDACLILSPPHVAWCLHHHAYWSEEIWYQSESEEFKEIGTLCH